MLFFDRSGNCDMASLCNAIARIEGEDLRIPEDLLAALDDLVSEEFTTMGSIASHLTKKHQTYHLRKLRQDGPGTSAQRMRM